MFISSVKVYVIRKMVYIDICQYILAHCDLKPQCPSPKPKLEPFITSQPKKESYRIQAVAE